MLIFIRLDYRLSGFYSISFFIIKLSFRYKQMMFFHWTIIVTLSTKMSLKLKTQHTLPSLSSSLIFILILIHKQAVHFLGFDPMKPSPYTLKWQHRKMDYAVGVFKEAKTSKPYGPAKFLVWYEFCLAHVLEIAVSVDFSVWHFRFLFTNWYL